MEKSAVAPAGSEQSAVAGPFSSTYRNYVLGVLVAGYVLNSMDRTILGILLQPIKVEFGATDTQLGLLGGIAFALFYATVGIPIAAWADRTNRRNVLAAAIALWSSMTALCGMAASFTWLLLARIGTAVGEAGGTPPSHSLISDYFSREQRATALSIYALGIPIGGMLAGLVGGWGNELFGWRYTMIIAGLPGVLLALIVRFTVIEPPRGLSDQVRSATASNAAPPLASVLGYLWARHSFRHMTLAAALHALAWYGAGAFNAAFFMRSHELSSGVAGSYLAAFSLIGGLGTFFGGYLSDRLSVRTGDRRWYMWVPGIAVAAMVPFQFTSYLAGELWMVLGSFTIMVVLASMFFGPSFAVTQGLATLRMRAVATSVLLFIQTLIGLGIGPLAVGYVSDLLMPTVGSDSLRYALVGVGLVNVWSAAHYFWGARTLRADLAETERLTRAGAG